MTSRELTKLVELISKWGWGIAIPQDDDPNDPIGGMIIGSREFIHAHTENSPRKFIYAISKLDETETH